MAADRARPSTGAKTKRDANDLDLITIVAAAKLLGVSEYMMRRLVADKSIPSIRFGQLLRVRESDVRAYVDRQLAS